MLVVGGHNWNVYKGTNGSNQVFSFLRTSDSNSGTRAEVGPRPSRARSASARSAL
ncbi:hypothetical protein [Streptomyces yerevanensis]|uniref:hypothetical protein n=1 Tax=Streptomyces yerevanensis TaxID=66378 RepID=UPI000A882567